MKMAKATEKDIEAAGELLRILDTIDGRFGGPWPTDGPESLDEALTSDDGDSVSFDADNRKHLQGLYNSLAKLLRQAPNFQGRVIGGMCYVILYDKNKIVDPSADVLELHPRFAAMEQQRDALLADVDRCYKMLLSEPDTQGALFKAENILREAIASAKGGAA